MHVQATASFYGNSINLSSQEGGREAGADPEVGIMQLCKVHQPILMCTCALHLPSVLARLKAVINIKRLVKVDAPGCVNAAGKLGQK